MNYFLILIILGICGGAYYEHTTLQEKSATDQKQLSDLGSKVDALQSENKKLEGDKTQLTKSNADAWTKVAVLTKQIQADQNALAEVKKAASPVLNSGKLVMRKQSPPVSTNNLGTITTLDGKIFQSCQLLKVRAESIVISDSAGITEIRYGLMPPDLQKKFGYDPQQASELTEAQVQYQEEQRTVSAQAPGN